MNIDSVVMFILLIIAVAIVGFVGGYLIGILTERIHDIDELASQYPPYDWAQDQDLFEE